MKTKQVKKLEAQQRQAVYDALTVEQKLELCASRRGSSKKEVARLLAQV